MKNQKRRINIRLDQSDIDLIDQLDAECLLRGVKVNRTEIIRSSLEFLNEMQDEAFHDAIEAGRARDFRFSEHSASDYTPKKIITIRLGEEHIDIASDLDMRAMLSGIKTNRTELIRAGVKAIASLRPGDRINILNRHLEV